jgi:energy-coupling factor transport system permease protein
MPGEYFNYIPGNTTMHKLDPRIKIISYFILTIGIFLTSNGIVQIFFLVIILSAFFLSNVTVRDIWSAWGIFILLILLFYPLFFYIYMQDLMDSIWFGLLFSYKFLMVMILTSVIVSTTSPQQICIGLNKLGVPFNIAFIISLPLVFFPVIQKEIFYVYKIQKTRGFKLRFNPIHPIKSFQRLSPIIIPSIFLLLQRAWELSLSLKIRGYGHNRMTYRKYILSNKDILFLISVLLIFELSILVNLFPDLNRSLNLDFLFELML